jgi:hypothetical protein
MDRVGAVVVARGGTTSGGGALERGADAGGGAVGGATGGLDVGPDPPGVVEFAGVGAGVG